MNKLLLTIALIAAAMVLRAQSPAAPAPTESPAAVVEDSAKDIVPRWSVVGEWSVTHPLWRDVVTLSADGSLVTSRERLTGKWLLAAEGGTPMIVILWDLYGTESATMVDANHFRGKTEKGKFIDMRRTAEPR